MIYRRLLRVAALPLTNRRWAAPLSAVAVGLGLFIGVAIGPGAAGTLATGASPILVDLSGRTGSVDAAAGDGAGAGRAPAEAVRSFPETGPPAAAQPSFPESAASEFVEAESPSTSSPAATEPATAPPPDGEGGEQEKEQPALAGVVVHVNPAAGSYSVAGAGGTLSAVHAGRPPAPGTEIEVPTRPLANGTFAEAGRRVRTGIAERATLSGIVTYVDATAGDPAYVVSSRGTSVLVHVEPAPGIPTDLPALGAPAEAEVEIGPPPAVAEPTPTATPAPEAAPSCAPDPTLLPPPPMIPPAVLWQRQLRADGAPFNYGEFEGILTALCPGSAELAISADDTRQGLRDLVFEVPGEIATGDLVIGQSVTATATIEADGSLALTGLASDERATGADDAKSARGDLKP